MLRFDPPRTRTVRRRLRRGLISGLLAVCALGASGVARSQTPPDDRGALLERLERAETYLGRHGIGRHLGHYKEIRVRAEELDLPVAEARARLILGRSLLNDAGQAHLELAAEAFRKHGEPAWEALARLQIGRELQGEALAGALWLSSVRDEAVGSLRSAIRLARAADAPVTEGEAHWVLASVHRLEGAYGPAIEHFDRAVQSFERAELPLVATVAGMRLAETYRLVGQPRDAGAVLEGRLGALEEVAGFEDLQRLHETRPEPPSNRETAELMERVARRLRRRGFPDLAAHYDRVAEFFAERAGRDRPGVITAEDREAMMALHIQARKERREKAPRWDATGTPLLEFMEEHPDPELVQRTLEIALRREIEGKDHQIRWMRLQRRLSEEESVDPIHAALLERARETGVMPELPVEWMVRQLERAPDGYRGKLGSLSSWVENRAADLYAWLTRRVEGGILLPGEIDRSNFYYPVNAWQKRYCENLKTAFTRYGAPDEYTCYLRSSIHRLADDLSRHAASDLPAVSERTRLAVLVDEKRRLEALLEDPSRLGAEIEAGELSEFFDQLFFDARNPGFSEATGSMSAYPAEVIAVREISRELTPSELRERSRRRDRIECALAHQLTLREWLAELYTAEELEHQAAAHRTWVQSFREKQRKQFPPKAHVVVGSSEPEPVWGVSCGDTPNPSFLDLESVEPRAERPAAEDDPLVAAFEDLEAGRYHEAARTFRAYEQADIERPELRFSVLQGLGRAYEGLGEPGRAIAAFEGAVEALESTLGAFRSPRRLAAYAERLSGVYDRLIGLLVDEGRPEEAFEVSERARARAFLHQRGGRSMSSPPAGSTETAGAADSPGDGLAPFRRAQQELRSRILFLERLRDHPEAVPAPGSAHKAGSDARSASPERRARIQHDLKLARARHARIVERIARTDPAYAALAGVRVVRPEEVRRTLLPRGTVLLSYHLLPDRGLAWVVDSDSIRLVELPLGIEEVGGKVDLFRKQIAALRPFEDTAAELYRALVAPVLQHLGDRTVLLVPHGPLHHLPFAALRDSAQGAFLGETLTWTTVPSASALRFLPQSAAETPSRPVIVGDPDGSLSSARTEARRVGELFGAAPLLGGQAREETVRERLPEANLLHLAAHAVSEPSDPLFSRIALAPPDEFPEDGTADGRLEVQEIYELDLRHLGLVTLSACNSGVGTRTGGDDVTSLRRAFLASGANRVISTLWRVEDDATAAWSTAFYRRLRDGEAVAAALRGAQAEIRADERWRHPYFWAGFVASGLPEQP